VSICCSQLQGRNKYGKEGYFPQSYVSAVEGSRPSTPPHHLQSGATSNSLQSIYHVYPCHYFAYKSIFTTFVPEIKEATPV